MVLLYKCITHFFIVFELMLTIHLIHYESLYFSLSCMLKTSHCYVARIRRQRHACLQRINIAQNVLNTLRKQFLP